MTKKEMDDEGEEKRIHKFDSTKQKCETTVAVTTQESLDGIRKRAMRISSIDELESDK